MLLRLYLPVLILILLKNLDALANCADAVVRDFQADYRNATCARWDVYQRNLKDARRYLEARFPYVKDQAQTLPELQEEEGACQHAGYAVYREVNPKLPMIYPNWLSLETKASGVGEEKDDSHDP